MMAVGAVAGTALTLAQYVLPDLDAVEHQAVGIVVTGAALAGYVAATGQDSELSELVVAYWVIAAIAGIPAVVTYWGRRRAARTERRLSIAERDYRGNVTSAAPGSGHL